MSMKGIRYRGNEAAPVVFARNEQYPNGPIKGAEVATFLSAIGSRVQAQMLPNI